MTIKELRIEKKLSQSALAKAIGVNESAIGHMEHGRMKVSPKIAAKIWEIYGVAVDLPEGTEGPAGKTLAPKITYANQIIIQSPLGGEITPEQVRAKIPADADKAYVRVDQNTIWWVRGEESGGVIIWNDQCYI